MSNQLIPQFQQFFNANGVAESGLELYTYEAGTLVNKETFQTYGGTSNTNPILMDSAGFPPAGIYGSGSYRLILKDSEGVTLKDLDDVVLTEGLQPDVNGNYIMTGTLSIGDAVIDASGDYVVSLSGSEIMRITPDGNIGYYFAFIPATLTAGYFHAFNGESDVTVVNDGLQTSWTGNNFYHSSGWKFKTSGYAIMKELDNATGEVIEYVSDASGASNSPITWIETKRTTPEGNYFYNGAPVIPVGSNVGDLSVSWVHHIYPTHTEMYTVSGISVQQKYSITNGYRAFDGIIYSLQNINYCTYLLMDSLTPKLESRQSTVVSTAVGQPMIMTTPLALT